MDNNGFNNDSGRRQPQDGQTRRGYSPMSGVYQAPQDRTELKKTLIFLITVITVLLLCLIAAVAAVIKGSLSKGNSWENVLGDTFVGSAVTEAAEDEEQAAQPEAAETVVQTAEPEAESAAPVGDISWTLQDGVLTIDGSGDMNAIAISAEGLDETFMPWFKDRKTITEVVIEPGVTTIGESAFFECESLTSITIPDSVTAIGEYAFLGCEALTSVTLPDSVTAIGADAFFNCTALTSITIPAGVTSIGGSAFADCDALKNVYYTGSESGWTSIAIAMDNECLTDAAIHYSGSASAESTTAPESAAPLEAVSWTLQDGVLTISGSGDMNTLADEYDDMPWADDSGIITEAVIEPGVTTIADTAFNDCVLLTSVTIPDSVTAIGEYAFYGCEALTSVTVPDSVTAIGSGAFKLCKSLTSVTLSNSVTAIADETFKGCYKLASVTIPDSVTSIGGNAFFACNKLASVTIPAGVASIEDGAFAYCGSLTDVYCTGSESGWAAVVIGADNECLTGADIHFGSPDGIPA